VTSLFPGYTPHVTAKPKTLSRQQVIEGKIKGEMEVKEDEDEDVRSYWMTLRKGDDTLI
jgi:hypothetical protein